MRKFQYFLISGIFILGISMIYQSILGNTSDKQMEYKVQSAHAENLNDDNFTVLVQSPIYNAMVTLDKDAQEVNVKLLDKDVSEADKARASHYIKLSNTDISQLIQDADSLFNQFKSGDLMDKYNFVTDMLNSYDTNISNGDLISVALSFLK